MILKFPEGFGVSRRGLDATGDCYETCTTPKNAQIHFLSCKCYVNVLYSQRKEFFGYECHVDSQKTDFITSE